MSFDFNEHGVCTDPEQLVFYKYKRLVWECYISLAECCGKWSFGYNVMFSTRGACGGPAICCAHYDTRDDALYEAIESVERYIYCAPITTKQDKEVAAAFEHFKEQYGKPVEFQLALF